MTQPVRIPHYINGQRVHGNEAAVTPVFNPATGASFVAAAVPLPSSVVLVLAGLVALVWSRRPVNARGV